MVCTWPFSPIGYPLKPAFAGDRPVETMVGRNRQTTYPPTGPGGRVIWYFPFWEVANSATNLLKQMLDRSEMNRTTHTGLLTLR